MLVDADGSELTGLVNGRTEVGQEPREHPGDFLADGQAAPIVSFMGQRWHDDRRPWAGDYMKRRNW